jgi:hypothetical protein
MVGDHLNTNTGKIKITQLDGILTTLMLKCLNKTVLKNRL